MKKSKKTYFWVFVMLIMSVIILSLLSKQAEPTHLIYNRPIGGEERTVQQVEIYCFTGASKGATETNVWCQETVLKEWSE